MKKIYTFILIAAAALFAASCAENPVEKATPDGEAEILSFTTEVPSVAEKTVLGDEIGQRSVTWAEGDLVKVYYGTNATNYSECAVDAAGVINVRVQSSSYKNFFAVYPNTITAKMASASQFNVVIPNEQDGNFAKANIMAAHADAERILRFRNAASLLCVEVGDIEADQLVVRANDGTPIAGTVDLTFDAETGDIATAKPESNCTPEITVALKGAGKYYVAILPDADLKAGIAFRFLKGGVPVSAVLSRAKLTTAASELRNIGRIDNHLSASGDFYVKANGSGNGSSWTEAASPEKLMSMINARGSDGTMFDGTTIAWRLGGGKVYVAQGTYKVSGANALALAAKNGEFTICGGYYEGSTGTDLTQYDPGKYPTVFTADEGTTILELAGGEGGVLNISGITLKGANVTHNGGALICNAPGLKVNFNKCIFQENVTTGHGGAMALDGGEFTFTECQFLRNQATTTIPNSTSDVIADHDKASYGGAVYANSEKATLYFDRCHFKGNTAFAAADIELRRGASAYIFRSSFVSGNAMAGNNFGIYPARSINADAMDGKQGKVCLCNCTLTKSASVYSTNGGLPQIAPTAYFCIVCLCTFHDPAIANYRNNARSSVTSSKDLNWIIGNLFVNSNGNAINLATSATQHGFYNILGAGKNNYANLAETDSKAAEENFTEMKFDSDNNIYKWSIDETKFPINRPARAQIKEIVSGADPEFDAWLSTLNESPYSIDQTGKQRNPGKITPGAWDVDFNNY